MPATSVVGKVMDWMGLTPKQTTPGNFDDSGTQRILDRKKRMEEMLDEHKRSEDISSNYPPVNPVRNRAGGTKQ